MTIDDAKQKAREFAAIIKNDRQDPREIERQREEDKQAAIASALELAERERLADLSKEQAAALAAVTVGEVWGKYLAERRPHWSALHYRDHETMMQAGGEQRQRGKGKTIAGPLAHFMTMQLVDVTEAAVLEWAAREAKTRPARTRLALRILKAFLRWCASEPDYKVLTTPTAASGNKTREAAGKKKAKNDYIQREQLSAWFAHVRQIPNPVISAYLQCLLLTGARREELAELKWKDVNFQWRGMELKDKMEGTRPVPLTPFVAHLLAGLPKRNQWVFSSVKTIQTDEHNAARRARYHAQRGTKPPEGDVSTGSETGRLVEPSIAHRKACAAAGLAGLTLHGLRRSFASLCEWLDIPGGISAQIQGHAPQGVREQNYIRRPLDLLRVHHEKIEAWILEQAGIKFDAEAEPGKLQLVAGGVAS
jgi:integrase